MCNENDGLEARKQEVRDRIQEAIRPHLTESVPVDPELLHQTVGSTARRLNTLLLDPESNVEGYRMVISASASDPAPRIEASLKVRPQSEMVTIEIVKTPIEKD